MKKIGAYLISFVLVVSIFVALFTFYLPNVAGSVVRSSIHPDISLEDYSAQLRNGQRFSQLNLTEEEAHSSRTTTFKDLFFGDLGNDGYLVELNYAPYCSGSVAIQSIEQSNLNGVEASQMFIQKTDAETQNAKENIIKEQYNVLSYFGDYSSKNYSSKDGAANKTRSRPVYQCSFNGFKISEQELSIANSLKSSGKIKNIYLNYKVKINADVSSDSNKTFIQSLRIDAVQRDLNLTGEGVTIAVIDTGIDGSSQMLNGLASDASKPKIIAFQDYINYGSEAYDDFGHGTHVAAIAAGKVGGINNELIGVAPNAKIVGIKVLDAWGSGAIDTVLSGIEYSIQHKQDYNISIISMSLGVDINGDGTSPLEKAVDLAVDHGIVVIAASGNSGPIMGSVGLPATSKKVIAVGAVDSNFNIADFSSRGPAKDGRVKPDISAIGVDVMSAVPTGGCFICDPSGYLSLSGTSMATPEVSGFVALLLQQNKSLTPSQIRSILINTAWTNGLKIPNNNTGYGVINPLSATVKSSNPTADLEIVEVTMPSIIQSNETSLIVSALVRNNGKSAVRAMVKLNVSGSTQKYSYLIIGPGRTIKTSLSISRQKFATGVYFIQVSVDPVVNETIISNNVIEKKLVVARKIVRASMLRSFGTDYASDTIFPEFNSDWAIFGDTALVIDFEGLNKKLISAQDLKASNADVLIISSAMYSSEGWQFADSEIAAINQYVTSGHGIVATGGTFGVEVPNNMKLAKLFGISPLSKTYEDRGYLNYRLSARDLILTKNVSDEYLAGGVFVWDNITMINSSTNRVFAKSLPDMSMPGISYPVIMTTSKAGKGTAVYISQFIEFINSWGDYGSPNENDRQILYNSIVWAANASSQKDFLILDSNVSEFKIKRNSNLSIPYLITKLSSLANSVNISVFMDGNKTFNDSKILSSSTNKFNFSFNSGDIGRHVLNIIVTSKTSNQETYLLNNNINIFYDSVPAVLTRNYSDSLVDSNLLITAQINSSEDVKYLGSFDIYSNLFNSYLGTYTGESNDLSSSGSGKWQLRNLTFIISNAEISKYHLNGPYKIKNILLTDEQGFVYDFDNKGFSTKAYTF